jgi:DNA (cytosine-5)-methyltransferase 1
MNDKIKAIDLFAGIGGIRLGFERAFGDRLDVVFTSEIDKYSCQTYRANFKDEHDPQSDITTVNPAEIPDFDLLLAGFPCQAFSIAGKQRGFEETRGTLFFYVANIIKEKQPKVFFLENVKNLVHHNKGKTFEVILNTLTKDLGYTVYYSILNASDFGLPQKRPRIYLVGFREPNNSFQFPKPLENKPKVSDILQSVDQIDEKYFLSQQYRLGLQAHKDRHKAKGNGFGYQIIPKDGIANTVVCGGMGRERNLIQEECSPNAWAKEGDSLKLRNKDGIRKMTEREWARLQGFPDSFKIPVSMTRAYKQFGNSVAVNVIEAIAFEIKQSKVFH